MSLLLHMFLTAATTLKFEAQCKSFFRWSACISQIHTLELKIDFNLHSPLCLFFLHGIKRNFSINSHNNLTSSINFLMQYSSAALLETPEVHLFVSHSEKCKLCVCFSVSYAITHTFVWLCFATTWS